MDCNHWKNEVTWIDNLQQCAHFWTHFSFVVVSMFGWMNQRQQQFILYLIEENRVLRLSAPKRALC